MKIERDSFDFLSKMKTAMYDKLARSQFFTRRHKDTKNGILKTFRFFFVISVIFV